MNTFIVFDGMDGSGKGTVLDIFRQYCESKSIDVVFTREPGGCPDAELIRKKIFDNPDMPSRERFDLMWEARMLHMSQTILPSLRAGKHVFCDRFDSSTWAYDVCAAEQFGLIEEFVQLRKMVVEKKKAPDLYVILDLEPEIARDRVVRANREKNFLDDKSIEFYRRVREGFIEFSKTFRSEVVPAYQEPKHIFEDIFFRLKKRGFVF